MTRNERIRPFLPGEISRDRRRHVARDVHITPLHGLRLAGKSAVHADTETHQQGKETGTLVSFQVISVCAAFVSLVVCILCTRYRSGSSRFRVKFSKLKRRKLFSRRTPRPVEYEDAMSTMVTATSSSHRTPHPRDYEEAVLAVDRFSPTRLTTPQKHKYDEHMLATNSCTPSHIRNPRLQDYEMAKPIAYPSTSSSFRTPRLHDYEMAKPIGDPSTSSSLRTPRLHDYELAKPVTDPSTPSCVRTPHPHNYEDVSSLPLSPEGTRLRLDSQGYTTVEILPDPRILPTESIPSEYNRLGTHSLQRTISDPLNSCKAYDHVLVGSRSISTGTNPSVNGSSDVSAQIETSLKHEYDVGRVAMTYTPRVEVIDGIYNKLKDTPV